MLSALFIAAATLIGYLGGRIVLRYATRRGLVDQPGERRSHDVPTPRGGGIGIACALLAGVGVLGLTDLLDFEWALGLGGGLLLVAGIGWWEDHRPVRARVRIGIHALAAGWLLFVAGGSETMQLGFATISLGPLDELLPFIGILWLTNLYNFMDGIDTLAAGEGIFAGLLIGGWFWLVNEPGAALLGFAVVAACAGFLPWNLPPARLFMGDVGSTSLGFVFAGLVVYGEQTQTLPALAGMVILGLFVFDATFTLTARWLKGGEWYTAHREHAYQCLVRAGWGHGKAGLSLMAVNILLFLPAAALMFAVPVTQSAVAVICIFSAWLLWRYIRKEYKSDENPSQSQ